MVFDQTVPTLLRLQVAEKLEAELDIPQGIRMHWTGCPNSCGQVWVCSASMTTCRCRTPSCEDFIEGTCTPWCQRGWHHGLSGAKRLERPRADIQGHWQRMLSAIRSHQLRL